MLRRSGFGVNVEQRAWKRYALSSTVSKRVQAHLWAVQQHACSAKDWARASAHLACSHGRTSRQGIHSNQPGCREPASEEEGFHLLLARRLLLAALFVRVIVPLAVWMGPVVPVLFDAANRCLPELLTGGTHLRGILVWSGIGTGLCTPATVVRHGCGAAGARMQGPPSSFHRSHVFGALVTEANSPKYYRAPPAPPAF